MNRKIYALLLEDVKKDVELFSEMLTEAGFELTLDVVEAEKEYVSHIKNNNYNIIFADFTLPSFNGQIALELAKKYCPNIPFVCISGTIGEDRAVELLKQGATDYILKDRMERLPFATKRALDAANHLGKFRQAEIELQTNRKLLQTIINNAIDPIYIKDVKGKYILFNHAAENAIGKHCEDVIGKDDTFIYSATEAEMSMLIDKQVIERNVPFTYEETLTLADGKKHIFLTIKCPMFDDSGNPSGLFGIARDITERKQMEQNLQIAKEKAEENDRLKTAFLHNISHEVRTPMNAIMGFSTLLTKSEINSDERVHFTEIITQNCNQLLNIINDIVSISTIEAGQEKITENVVKLNSVFENLYDEFLPRSSTRGIELCFPSSSFNSEIDIITDEAKLKRVLSSLIDNAIKFTKEGKIQVAFEFKEDSLEFSVKDTGIGIPEKMFDEIFERFRQVESNDARNYGGSGLGLSISKAYVELLGGKIWLNSQEGKGSIFFFNIPLKRNLIKSSAKDYIADNELNIKDGSTILIAEDEDSNFTLLQVMLEDFKINLVWAKNGNEAVEMTRLSNVIDLILMDIKMPVMDGFEATKLIRTFNPDVPIIAQTAYISESDKSKAFECGCNDFLCKPFKRDLLIYKINLLCKK